MIELLLPIGIYLWYGIGVLYITFTPRDKLIGSGKQSLPKRFFLLVTWPLWVTAMSMASFIEWVESKIARWIFKKAFGGIYK